ncbi:MAG TPA: hypothetical protein VIJ94_08530 [Caulobacteraceae bacterium]
MRGILLAGGVILALGMGTTVGWAADNPANEAAHNAKDEAHHAKVYAHKAKHEAKRAHSLAERAIDEDARAQKAALGANGSAGPAPDPNAYPPCSRTVTDKCRVVERHHRR